MKSAVLIAKDEWRFWRRSRLALASALIFLALLVVTAVLTGLRSVDERHARLEHQSEAEETFLAQPDRHPHRMVHYGHYAFRTPPPLAVVDPGLDPITGQSIFLEGHRQNAAMLAESDASAEFGDLDRLSPASVYQVFGPLLLILLGHGAIVRERESRTLGALLAQGTSGTTLFMGKALALLGVIGVMLLPLVASALIALMSGESLLAVLAMLTTYFLYLAVWGLLALLLSAALKTKATVLASLTGLWLALTLLVPSLSVNNVARFVPLQGQIETNFEMLADLRELGDGHNAADPAFERLRRDLLAEYDAESVEELPINLRGVVAQYSEEQLTDTLNRYAERRMDLEQKQARALEWHGWLSPLLAVSNASRAIAGTDLRHHQRFLREAEALRYDFVQGLNRLHAEELSYVDDINRSRDAAAEQRTRIGAENWQLLESFRFAPDTVARRTAAAMPSLLALLLWLAVLGGGALRLSARARP